MPDKPIVTSLLEVDWYKFTMSYFIWRFYRNVRVRFGFKNRHRKTIWLPAFVRADELRAQLEHVRTLRLTTAELGFLRESPFIPRGFFSEEYLSALAGLRLDEVELRWNDREDAITVEGDWWAVTFWETIIMNVVNVLYFRELARREGRTASDIREEGHRRLMPKLELMATRPRLMFAPFGLRRTADVDWNREMEGTVCETLPNQVLGISNVRSAMLYDKPPTGTCAHEMPMVIAALAGLESDAALRRAPMELTRAWFRAYGAKWAVAIPDTFGSESFLADADKEIVHGIRPWKIDSGDPFERGERHIRFFRDWGIDPLSKSLIFCDGLEPELQIRLFDHFDGRVGFTQGPGTNWSNDVGFKPVSMVVKATAVQSPGGIWVTTVKLSDNLEKAQGEQDEVDRYVRVFDYHNRFAAECRV